MPTLTTTAPPFTFFEQFLKQCPDEGRFEWVNGEIIEMVNSREHIDIAALIAKLLDREVDRLQLNYVVHQEVYLRTRNAEGKIRGRIPDVSVIDRDLWRSDLSNYSALIDPIQLAVEVVSSNWENDYVDKLDKYQRLGIKEYWIVDYLACCEADPCGIGSRNILGELKFPTVFIYTLGSVTLLVASSVLENSRYRV